MNVAQICRKALFEAGLVLAGGASSPLITQAELLTWANDGNDELEKQLRNAEQDFLWVTRNSTDADFDWENETYDPSDFGFDGTTTNRSRNLPPDLLLLKEIRITTSGDEETLFQQEDHASPLFQDTIRSPNPQRDLILWDMVDERTLYVANPPAASRDVQISYIQRSPRLRYFSGSSTITTVQNDETVEGLSTPAWLINDLDNAGAVELGVGAGAWAAAVEIAGVTGPYVDTEAREWPIAEFTDADTLELKTAWRATAITTKQYYIASVPASPREHHHILVTYVKMKIAEKIKNYKDMGAATGLIDRKYAKMIGDIQERQRVDPEFVEEYDPEM